MKKSILILHTVFWVFFSFANVNATLVGYWNFNEDSGTIAHDSSGYTNHGELINGASWAPGKYGNGLGLDGVNDYVNVPHSVSISTGIFTVSFWVRLNDLNRIYTLLDKRHTSESHTRNFAFYYRANDPQPTGIPDDYLAVNIGDGTWGATNYYNAAYTPAGLVQGEFFYLAATYDQSLLKLYLNGILMATTELI